MNLHSYPMLTPPIPKNGCDQVRISLAINNEVHIPPQIFVNGNLF